MRQYMYCVYILKSVKDGSFYVGCTSNLEKRVKAHNSGKTPSLKSKRPLEIIHKEDYTTSTEAFAREKQIKSYRGGVAFKKLLGSVA
jgi:putative endonuclease